MKAMIFAAGLGTRLKPITDTMPKALVPVAGKPLLQHNLEKLQGVDVEGVVVNVHHFADQIEAWVKEHRFQMPVCLSDERDELLETGGGILHAREYLQGCGRFLVHNVDIISNLDIEGFVSEVQEAAMATLLVSERKTNRYLLFNPVTMRLEGWTNIATGEVRSPYRDLDPDKCLKLAFSGIHILSDNVFGVMEEYARKIGSKRFPIIDFYLEVCDTYNIYGIKSEDLKMIDVGKLDSLAQAEELIKNIK